MHKINYTHSKPESLVFHFLGNKKRIRYNHGKFSLFGLKSGTTNILVKTKNECIDNTIGYKHTDYRSFYYINIYKYI